MLHDDYNAWDECPEADDCELIRSFLELVDAMVRDIQHLKAEAVRARYRLAMETDSEQNGSQRLISSQIWICCIMTAWHIRSFPGSVMMGDTP